MIIIGAGFSGLIAAQMFPGSTIIEAESESSKSVHKALLRFRTPEIGHAVRIPFREVTVRKAVWDEGFQQINPALANAYSRKVAGRAMDRSIWSLETVKRYIAPENFYEQLLERTRVQWQTRFNSSVQHDESIISTMPLPVLHDILFPESAEHRPSFEYAPITVRRWRIKNCDVHQTVYFPSHDTTLYRASITGDLLIAEYVGEADNEIAPFEVFGFDLTDVEEIETASQKYGKIAPCEDDAWRRAFIRDTSTNYQIYSLGRFATWRNLLLDDILNDIHIIKQLIESDGYGHARRAAL